MNTPEFVLLIVVLLATAVIAGTELYNRSKPILREGDHVAVYVYRKDPWKSWFVA